jgi:hypothetical protein
MQTYKQVFTLRDLFLQLRRARNQLVTSTGSTQAAAVEPLAASAVDTSIHGHDVGHDRLLHLPLAAKLRS